MAKDRMFTAVDEAMSAVANLAVEADEATVVDLVEELKARGIGPLERRDYATKGKVKMTGAGFFKFAEEVGYNSHEVELSVGKVANDTVLIVDVTREDVQGRSFNTTRYVAAGDSWLKL